MSLLSPQLEAFVCVVKCRTVHAAAQTLFLTQTAVTQRIRALERSLKTTLFIRTRRGMVLTTEGEALMRYCINAKALEGETLAHIQGAGIETEKKLTITAATSIMRSRILPHCLPIMKAYPNLLIHFKVDDSDVRHEILRAGQSDFAILQSEHMMPEMAYKKLKSEQYVLVGSCDWKGRSLKDIVSNERIIDFTPEDTITYNYLKQYDLFDHARHSRYYINRTDDIAYLISKGVGYSVLTKEFAELYVQNKQLIVLNQSKIYNVQLVLAWYDRPEPPCYFSALIDAIH
jgi:LysR family transcriptional regulator (chromosome initiation inhibitor)